MHKIKNVGLQNHVMNNPCFFSKFVVCYRKKLRFIKKQGGNEL